MRSEKEEEKNKKRNLSKSCKKFTQDINRYDKDPIHKRDYSNDKDNIPEHINEPEI
jgi:hypothetical protein